MSGCQSGFKTWMKEKQPSIVYIHCSVKRLELSVLNSFTLTNTLMIVTILLLYLNFLIFLNMIKRLLIDNKQSHGHLFLLEKKFCLVNDLEIKTL